MKLSYDPFSTLRPGRWSIGLRPIEHDDWLVLGEDTERQIEEKQRVLAEHFDTCVASVPESADACTEAVELLSDWLVARGQPDRNHGEGIDALVSVSRCISEDLVVMLPESHAEGGYRLGAASLCFPTRWLLSAKLNKPMIAIHAPVPGYEEEIGRATNRLFDSLSNTQLLMRSNWSLLDSGELFQPAGSHAMQPDASFHVGNVGDHVWVRSERQTLKRLPRTGAILFTIRVFQCRLDELDASHYEGVVSSLSAMGANAVAHKSISNMRASVLEWLSDRHQ